VGTFFETQCRSAKAITTSSSMLHSKGDRAQPCTVVNPSVNSYYKQLPECLRVVHRVLKSLLPARNQPSTHCQSFL